MFDLTQNTGSSADVISVLRLTPMNSSTRVSTIKAVRDLREALTGGPDLPAEVLFGAVAEPTQELRTKLGKRHVQILSDVKRAERAWSDAYRRDLVLKLRGRLPTLEDAIMSTLSAGETEKAKRTVQSLQKLAQSQATAPANLIATQIVIEPILRRLMPEDLDVQTGKSLSNKLALIRAAVKLVDPNVVSGREADVNALPTPWRALLKELEAQTTEHDNSIRAIFRRLAMRADREWFGPDDVTSVFLENFLEHEKVTKADSHGEKLRRAGRIWNDVVETKGLGVAPFETSGPQNRCPDVAWSSVPEFIRTRVDDALGRMVAPQGDEQWSSFIDDEDDDLGLNKLMSSDPGPGATVPKDKGTKKNLRAAVKRVWHAASVSPKIAEKPTCLEDLYRLDCLKATVGAIRKARRAKIEAMGEAWEVHMEGRYECSLVQALLSVGRSCDLPEELLEPVRLMTHNLDPSIVGTKPKSDGSLGYIYEDRKIGRHHEDMLRQFNEHSALKRWFMAPSTLWRAAEKWMRQGKKAPTMTHAALARSALIAQLSQRVTPMRRMNFARLRISGEESHLNLPIGAGEGTLILPAVEMKNLRSVYVSIDMETVRMLKRFIEIYRPIFAKQANADPENPHLFPGAAVERKERGENGGYPDGFGYITKEKMSQRFRQHIWKHCHLKMDMQVVRHIAAKVILDMDPSAMGLVQEVLGHKKIETTRSYYAEVNKIVAQQNYLQLLDQYARDVNLKRKIEFDI